MSRLVQTEEVALTIGRVGELVREDLLERFDSLELASTIASGPHRVAGWAAVQDVVAAMRGTDPASVRLRVRRGGPPRVADDAPVPLIGVSHHGRWAVAIGWWGHELPSPDELGGLLAELVP